MGGWGEGKEEEHSGPGAGAGAGAGAQQHLLGPRAEGPCGALRGSQGTGQRKDLGEICESTSFLSGMVEKAPGIWSLKAEACL